MEEGQTQLLYSLYGIVEHSGTMRSGHYTAFVKARPYAHANSGLVNGAAGNIKSLILLCDKRKERIVFSPDQL